VFYDVNPCVVLVVFTSLLVHATRQAVQRRRQLMSANSHVAESRRLAASIRTTVMLLADLGLFLVVDILTIAEYIFTFEKLFLKSLLYGHSDSPRFTELVLNIAEVLQYISFFVSLCSYPFNLVIYCTMSSQFRETCRGLICRRCLRLTTAPQPSLPPVTASSSAPEATNVFDEIPNTAHAAADVQNETRL